MNRWPSIGAVLLVSAALPPASAASADTYCIDARPTGPYIGSLELSFKSVDDRVVRRRSVLLKAIDPVRSVIVIVDGERDVELDLRQWRELRFDVDDGFSPMAQRAIPKKSSLPSIGRTIVPVAQLSITDGIVRFPGCTMPPDDRLFEVRFSGTLSFDPARGSAEIEGSQSRYDAPPPSTGNPGASK